jgi:hypothetical protein
MVEYTSHYAEFPGLSPATSDGPIKKGLKMLLKYVFCRWKCRLTKSSSTMENNRVGREPLPTGKVQYNSPPQYDDKICQF